MGPLAFRYDASNGSGEGSATHIPGAPPSLLRIEVLPGQITIPPLNAKTGSLKRPGGVPSWMPLPALPPNFQVEILPSLFQGTLDMESGAITLTMTANFAFRFGAIVVRGLPLSMDMSTGPLPRARDARWAVGPVGAPWSPVTGRFAVVGRAEIVSTGNGFMDRFIQVGIVL